jgi:hypothetical protein
MTTSDRVTCRHCHLAGDRGVVDLEAGGEPCRRVAGLVYSRRCVVVRVKAIRHLCLLSADSGADHLKVGGGVSTCG